MGPGVAPAAGFSEPPGLPGGGGRAGSGVSRGQGSPGPGGSPGAGIQQAPESSRRWGSGGLDLPRPPCWLSARASSCVMTRSMAPASEVPTAGGPLVFSPRSPGVA